jgi:hypothetical protein
VVTGQSDDPRARRRALAVGIVVIAIYSALAAWSGQLSPLARGPLLDGLAPVNYRWVNPPPELATTNQEPSSGVFGLEMGPKGVEGKVVFTSDNQVTVIVTTGSIAPKAEQQSVDLSVTPVDPATLSPPGDGLSVFGNAYRVEATYRPSGKAARNQDITEPFDIILVYPSTSTLHATSHEIVYSADGTTWERLETMDTITFQQAEASVPGVGALMVAGSAAASPGPGTGGGSTTLATALLVAAGCILLIGVALLIRSGR